MLGEKAAEGCRTPNPSGRATWLAAPLERGGPPPLLGNSRDNPSPSCRCCMACWGKKRQRAAALQIHRGGPLEWRRLWSAVALHRFWGIPGTTRSPNVRNSHKRPGRTRIVAKDCRILPSRINKILTPSPHPSRTHFFFFKPTLLERFAILRLVRILLTVPVFKYLERTVSRISSRLS